MKAVKKDYEGPFAKRLQELMNEHDPPLDLMGLADETGVMTYEHARKLLRGKSLPSDLMTRELAKFFGVDSADLESVVQEDKFQRQFGEGAEKPVFNPEVMPFATAWPMLTRQQQSDLMRQLKTYVTTNAKAAEKQKASR